MWSKSKKYQKDAKGKRAETPAPRRGVHGLFLGCAVTSFLAVALPANAGYISPGTTGGVLCTNTASFATYNDCVGQVTAPRNEANGNPTTLVNYLNGSIVDRDNNVGFIGFDGTTTPWGIQGDWLGISNQLNSPGELPGTSSDGFFSVTGDDRYSGDWSFDLGNIIIDYLVVTVKDGGGWSGYYYDLTGQELSTFSSTWDTLGITNGNGTPGPEISHMYAAYIPGIQGPDPDPDPDPDPMPIPGTLMLFGLGLLTLRASRRGQR